MRIQTIEDKLEGMRFHDWAMKLEIGCCCAWSAELRITLESNEYGPDISTLFYATGASNPQIAAEMVYMACKEWNKNRKKE